MRDALISAKFSDLPQVCSHNDLLAANWLCDSSGRLWLIDFEYAAVGDRFFDLANFSVNCGLSHSHDLELLAGYFEVAEESVDPAALSRLKLLKVFFL